MAKSWFTHEIMSTQQANDLIKQYTPQKHPNLKAAFSRLHRLVRLCFVTRIQIRAKAEQRLAEPYVEINHDL